MAGMRNSVFALLVHRHHIGAAEKLVATFLNMNSFENGGTQCLRDLCYVNQWNLGFLLGFTYKPNVVKSI